MTARRRTPVMIGTVSVACVAAMLRYPGGTLLDHETRRYSLAQNFLSDLGMTVAYNGEPNRLGAGLFVVALLTLVFGGIASLVPLMRELAAVPGARPWVRGVSVGLLVAGIAFIGVAFTPENRAMQLHVDFTVWGWRVIAVLSLLLGVAALRAGAAYRRAALIGIGTGVLLVGYNALFIWGPSGSTEAGLMVHVVAQKVAAIIVVAAILGLTGKP